MLGPEILGEAELVGFGPMGAEVGIGDVEMLCPLVKDDSPVDVNAIFGTYCLLGSIS
jgi:hypothetical protein